MAFRLGHRPRARDLSVVLPYQLPVNYLIIMYVILKPSVSFSDARRLFRDRGLYLQRTPTGRIRVYLRPGTQIDQQLLNQFLQ